MRAPTFAKHGPCLPVYAALVAGGREPCLGPWIASLPLPTPQPTGGIVSPTCQ